MRTAGFVMIATGVLVVIWIHTLDPHVAAASNFQQIFGGLGKPTPPSASNNPSPSNVPPIANPTKPFGSFGPGGIYA